MEVLLALLISGVLMTGLGSIFVMGIKTWQQSESKLELQRQGSLVISEIKKWTQPSDSVETGFNFLRVRQPETDSTLAEWHLFELRNHKLYRNDSLLTEDFEDRPGLRMLEVSSFSALWHPWLQAVEVEISMTLKAQLNIAKLPETVLFQSKVHLRNYSL